jgi:periplasmic protein TonB
MTYEGGHGGDPDDEKKGFKRFVKPAIGVLVVVGIGLLVWHYANDTAGVKRVEAPLVTTVIPVPPPPPPPPPKMKPPPEKQPEVQTPVAKPTAAPKPAEAPKPMDNAPKQMTMNAPAQAGTDNFAIAAGDGSGMAGSGTGTGGFGNATYSQYLVYALQQAVERDKSVQETGEGLRFSVAVNLWLEPSGRIVKVTIGKSTGDPKLDDAVVSALQVLGKLDEPPPPSWQYPVRLNLQGHQPG